VTFGPRKDKIFKKEIPSKMKRKALFMVLSEKARKNLLVVLDELKINKPKTKGMLKILEKLPCPPKFSKEKNKRADENNCLILLPAYDKKIILSVRNIPKIRTIEARNLNALDVLSSKYLLMPKDTIKKIKETFIGSEKLKAKSEK